MWGPVVTEETDAFFCRCQRGTNNTGEAAGMIQALLWLQRDRTTRPACICYDSEWAAKTIQGKWKVRKKDVKPIIAWAQELLAQVTATRQVSFVHVRGHSSDEGNDRADALVQWGKQQRGYARLRVGENDDGADTNIIKEGHIDSDGRYGRLAIEEYEKEKRRKREEKEKERTTTTTPRGYRTHPAAARPRFSDDQLGASAGDE
eukprot:COSAG04_NODE_1008_length_8786_cov_5.785706_2_plen_204_part_00